MGGTEVDGAHGATSAVAVNRVIMGGWTEARGLYGY
jgi:hypothetical protein